MTSFQKAVLYEGRRLCCSVAERELFRAIFLKS